MEDLISVILNAVSKSSMTRRNIHTISTITTTKTTMKSHLFEDIDGFSFSGTRGIL